MLELCDFIMPLKPRKRRLECHADTKKSETNLAMPAGCWLGLR